MPLQVNQGAGAQGVSIAQAALGMIPYVGPLANMGFGIYGLTQAKKLPPYLQQAIDELQKQASQGIDEQALISAGASKLARLADVQQARGASALASRGGSYTGALDSMIGEVSDAQSQGLGEVIASAQSLDQQAKSSAAAALGQVSGVASGIQTQQIQDAAGLIGKGLGDLAGMVTPQKPTTMDLMLEDFTNEMKGVNAERGAQRKSEDARWNEWLDLIRQINGLDIASPSPKRWD